MQAVPLSGNEAFRRNRAQIIFDLDQGNRTSALLTPNLLLAGSLAIFAILTRAMCGKEMSGKQSHDRRVLRKDRA
jgi:hypothetical protein